MDMYAEVKKRVAGCRPEQRLRMYATMRAASRLSIEGAPRSQLKNYQQAASFLEAAIDRVERELIDRDKARDEQRAQAKKQSVRDLKALAALVFVIVSVGIIAVVVHEVQMTPEERAAERKEADAREKARETERQKEILAQRHADWRESKLRGLAAAADDACDKQPGGCTEHMNLSDPQQRRSLNALVDRDEALYPDEWRSFKRD